MTKRNTPAQGIGLNYLKQFLKFLQSEHQCSQVYKSSPYRLKSSTIHMIKWCVSRQLISRREQYKSKFSSRKQPKVFYHITDNGRKLLEVIQ